MVSTPSFSENEWHVTLLKTLPAGRLKSLQINARRIVDKSRHAAAPGRFRPRARQKIWPVASRNRRKIRSRGVRRPDFIGQKNLASRIFPVRPDMAFRFSNSRSRPREPRTVLEFGNHARACCMLARRRYARVDEHEDAPRFCREISAHRARPGIRRIALTSQGSGRMVRANVLF